MKIKTLICPERRRTIRPPFAWIDRHFLFKGFMTRLTPQENLLYFFLVLVSDRDGLSWYSYDKICHVLKLNLDEFIQARDALIHKQLIAFEGYLFQVLALPKTLPPPEHATRFGHRQPGVPQPIAEIFARIAAEHK